MYATAPKTERIDNRTCLLGRLLKNRYKQLHLKAQQSKANEAQSRNWHHMLGADFWDTDLLNAGIVLQQP